MQEAEKNHYDDDLERVDLSRLEVATPRASESNISYQT